MIPKHEQFIGMYDDAIEPGFCDMLIREFETYSNLSLTIPGLTGGGGSKKVKSSEDLNILAFPSLFEFSNAVIKDIMDCYELYGQRYVGVKEYLAPHRITALQIQKYKAEQKDAYYAFHQEVMPGIYGTVDRVTTFILYLNTIDEGGETEFLEQSVRVRPIKNRLVIFPAGFTHVHRGNPVLSNQDKYILTGWLNFV